ncbi:hypothetical protein ACIGXM_04260 [Kitasatospora sp. NPDC052896]
MTVGGALGATAASHAGVAGNSSGVARTSSVQVVAAPAAAMSPGEYNWS